MQEKTSAIIGSAIFLVIAPGFVAGLVPWWISGWQLKSPLFDLAFLRISGSVLIALGLLIVLDSFARFAIRGLGTPAPVLPTRHLVVTGLYRYVRNPMYVGVVSTIIGQALLLGNVALLEYGASVWLCFHAFVLLYEEPTLGRSFGPEYQLYRNEVPRWIPRYRRGPPAM
ncbi:MAG TPA: isoprenylcysteine carboxylmethyltransferase family protein [Bryobacteraceae bacterium]|nr:isoprenylcysteine carboxylmethyltransferase family protein [Bryobacteraceae bacterium]